MSISVEAAAGIAAAILATIPICISGYRCWKQQRGMGRGRDTNSTRSHILPMWRPPQNGHDQSVPSRLWLETTSHGHGHHGASDSQDAVPMPFRRHTVHLETSRVVLSHQLYL
ncbi:hypothetical protein BJX66DRAFT_315499 [Aspergillus keveii]|uniref:Uncharacterized protein n=1 Tax=Aspergillus keveii TaxID=714993 RepID=A0ABR4FPE5_9EURO